MMKELVVFAAAFAICAAAGSSACGSVDTPACPRLTPGFPTTERPRALDDVSVDGEASGAVSLANATIEITGPEVVIRYAQDGVAHEVVYAVVSHGGSW